MSISNPKFLSAQKALDYISDDLVIGLGTGSTAEIFIELLSEKIKSFNNITLTSTSNRTTEFAEKLGLKITKFQDLSRIDLTIDGADEVDKNLNGIKGGGGALLFEKIVAKNSLRNIWIVDSSKLVNSLGSFPLPIEIVPFACNHLLNKFEQMKLNPKLRLSNGKAFITDSNNFIIDCNIGKIENPLELELELKLITGVVEVGLFNNIADVVIVGYSDKVNILERK
ncbi:MAG: ribose-5-phosphate isomerase RpiA [Ignavibacterium sp.]|nr:ribose-5-phosphate isomerase RpiA [Ignavibacterium sp.]